MNTGADSRKLIWILGWVNLGKSRMSPGKTAGMNVLDLAWPIDGRLMGDADFPRASMTSGAFKKPRTAGACAFGVAGEETSVPVVEMNNLEDLLSGILARGL